jgi:alpha-methylacyl-CoA racemase
VLDASALGPGPFASLLLASYGADVLRIERAGGTWVDTGYFNHGKRGIQVDLKSKPGQALVRRMAGTADVFLESYRPGVMERLGLGPAELTGDNRRLIYVRLTGWGHTGPVAEQAGHDIDYIALAGALAAMGGETPAPPMALLGDFAGGSLFAVIGTLLALHQRERTGTGQVVDAAIVDGVTTLMWSTLARSQRGDHGPRGTNLTDGGRPYYRTYRCADGRFFAVGAIESRFYAQLLATLGLNDEPIAAQDDSTRWLGLTNRMAEIFATQPRDYWTARFAGSDACGAPVLEIEEAAQHPHLRARMYLDTPAGLRLRPAPQLSGTPDTLATPPGGDDPGQVLADFGVPAAEAARAVQLGVARGIGA